MRYKAWGEVRYASGDSHTDKTYTGQRSYTDDFGLMFYNARWYDSSIGHFAQADNIEVKAGDTQSLDRFAYVINNPINGTDPTGHKQVCSDHWDAQQSKSVHECHDDGTPNYYNGYTKEELIKFWEDQFKGGHGSGCGPFSISMATNLYNGTHTYTGAQVEWALESVGAKIPGVGIPTWGGYEAMVQNFNPDNAVAASANNTIADLKDALANNYLPIVEISNQTDEQIRNDPFHATVGHYMVAVGYDKDKVYFLDPGSRNADLHPYTNQDFNDVWNEKPNFFIAPGVMYTLR
jgi:RHS repeat-associated protein